MAIFRGTIRSKTLMMDTSVNIVVPYEQHYAATKAREFKTVILLHGLKQNADAWPRMSRVEQYAHAAGFNVVMPEAQRSFYTDMTYGLAYFDYIANELPQMLSNVFRMPTDSAHLYVGGLSMGGFGAFKCALTYPERFAGVMSYSGALYCFEELSKYESILFPGEVTAMLGPDLRCPAESSLTSLAQKASASSCKPRMYLACGTEDSLLEDNRRFAAYLRTLGFNPVYEEWSGQHDWTFWDRACARSFALMADLDPQFME